MEEPTAMDFKSTGGIKRVFKAAGYSMQGFIGAWKNEAAFRQELSLAALMLPFAIFLDVSTLERIALIGVLALVLIVELLNSAVEAAIDRIGVEKHELSGRAKDLGSAAVFISLAMVIFVWASILAPKYLF
jgi:diacylglycerol kinase (ATP)